VDPSPRLTRRRALADRFWAKVTVVLRDGAPDFDACWEWRGERNGGTQRDRGRIRGEPQLDGRPGRLRQVAQVAWEVWHNQPFPAGKDACHTCDWPPCANPTHIVPGTHRQNMASYVARYGRLGVPKSEWPPAPRPQLPFEEEI